MSELRHDPIQKRWVIIAGERSGRPQDFAQPRQAVAENSFCPFCPGNEEKTPREISSIRSDGSSPDKPGWQVRVIPNKYPALSIEGELGRKGIGLYDAMNGVGAHEVVIDTPHHSQHVSQMTEEQLSLIYQQCQQRMLDLMNDQRFKYVLLFKNYGGLAGASLSHPHHQLIATPVTPITLANELQSSRDHHHFKERCLICDILTQELNSGKGIVHQNQSFVAYTPYASRFPFEMMVVPKQHSCAFTNLDAKKMKDLANMMRTIMGALRELLNDPPYNYLFHTAPNTGTVPRRSHYWETLEFDYHWHLEILPRLTRTAGFEWGTGFYINPLPPEEAAKALRQVIKDKA